MLRRNSDGQESTQVVLEEGRESMVGRMCESSRFLSLSEIGKWGSYKLTFNDLTTHWAQLNIFN